MPRMKRMKRMKRGMTNVWDETNHKSVGGFQSSWPSSSVVGG